MSKVLEAEPTVRVILVACRLSQSLRQPYNNADLPVLGFWLSTLRDALKEDPFWGADLLKHLEARAEVFEKGIRELIKQCLELEELIKRESNVANAAAVAPVKAHRYAPAKPTKLRTSKLAQRQTALAKEEDLWMQQIVVGCWTTLLADAARAQRKAPFSDNPFRSARTRPVSV